MIGTWGLSLHPKRPLEGPTYPRQASEASNWETAAHGWYIPLSTTWRDSVGLELTSRAPDNHTRSISGYPVSCLGFHHACHLALTPRLSPRNDSQGLSKNNPSGGQNTYRSQSLC